MYSPSVVSYTKNHMQCNNVPQTYFGCLKLFMYSCLSAVSDAWSTICTTLAHCTSLADSIHVPRTFSVSHFGSGQPAACHSVKLAVLRSYCVSGYSIND